MDKERILFVDDQEEHHLTVGALLRKQNYHIEFAFNGLEAIQKMNDFAADLILLDINMPGMSGFEVCRQLKENAVWQHIPVIFLTANNGIESITEGFSLGAVDYISKPFIAEELIARLRVHLELIRNRREIEKQNQQLAAINTELKNHNLFLQQLIDTIPLPVVLYDDKGRIQFRNIAFCRYFFISENEQVNFYDLFDNKDNKHKTEDQKVLKSGSELHQYEYTISSQQQQFTIFYKSCFHHENTGKNMIICVVSDISELKKLQADALLKKEQELKNAGLKLVQLGEFSNKLTQQTDLLYKHSTLDGKKIISSIRSSLTQYSTASLWEDFVGKFDNVHSDFSKVLLERHPDLSKNDIKLCILLRLNLSSKEISAMSFQNSESVDVARYRLRKKLNLDKSDNLVGYLSSF